MKVFTNYVPEGCDYFTAGKIYEVIPVIVQHHQPDLYYVVADNGEGSNISLGG